MKTANIAIISLLCLFLSGLSFAQEPLELHFIDVGEGDAILIQYKNNNLLIDTGNLLSGYKLVDYLIKNKVSEIKYLIITHPHPDHMAGVFFILPKFPVQEIYDNGQSLNDADDMERSYKMLVRSNKNYRPLKKWDRLELDGVSLEVIWPERPDSGVSYNENSLVIKLNYQDKFRCLLIGDFNNAGEDKLLKEKAGLKADILKVGHHGAIDALSEDFLSAVSPKIAIITSGIKSKAGIFSAVTASLLAKKNVKTYRTQNYGDIIISVNSEGNYTVETEKISNN